MCIILLLVIYIQQKVTYSDNLPQTLQNKALSTESKKKKKKKKIENIAHRKGLIQTKYTVELHNIFILGSKIIPTTGPFPRLNGILI